MEDCSIGFHFFEKVQDLPTRGAVDVEHFTVDGSLYLAFANYHGDIKKYKTSSMIYKMDNSTGRLSLYQTLQTRGAFDLEYFSIAKKPFLLSLIITMGLSGWTLQSINVMESCLSTFRNCQQKEQITSRTSRCTGRSTSQ